MATYSSRIEAAPAARWSWGNGLITRERVAPLVAGAVLLVIWEVWVRSQLPDFVARPSGIVMAIPSTIATLEFWSDVGATLGRKPDIFIPSQREIPRSVTEGRPIVTSRPDSAAAAAFRNLARLFLERPLPLAEQAERPRSRWSINGIPLLKRV